MTTNNRGARKEWLREARCAMSGQCCLVGRGTHPFARRLSKASASILPAALLMLMPKCPLCLAAWLTVATGVSFSSTGAGWLRWGIVLLWVGALGLMMWRRRFGHRPALLSRFTETHSA